MNNAPSRGEISGKTMVIWMRGENVMVVRFIGDLRYRRRQRTKTERFKYGSSLSPRKSLPLTPTQPFSQMIPTTYTVRYS
jgi:hypothetical protein